MTRLRGATVSLDGRRFGRILLALISCAVAATAGVLLVNAHARNAAIDRLRNGGLPVQVRLSDCLGLMGGSGSTPVGYRCVATYSIGATTYRSHISADGAAPASGRLSAVADPQDRGSITPAATLAAERPSAGGYVLPTALLVCLLAGLVLRWRRGKHGLRGRT